MSNRNTYWRLISGGHYVTDPPARLSIDEYHKPTRVYIDITNARLQRLIHLSLYHGAEIEDGQITVYGGIKSR